MHLTLDADTLTRARVNLTEKQHASGYMVATLTKSQKAKSPYKRAKCLIHIGVADGARTHDNRNHNPGLYQLSYSHRRSGIIA